MAVGGGNSILFFSGPVRFRCGGGVILQADSAEHFEAQNETHLIGHVVYEDSLKTFTSDVMDYLRSEQRMFARGNVEVRDKKDGSIIRGDTLRYLRPSTGQAEEQMTVTGVRPKAILYLRRGPDSADTAGAGPSRPPPDRTQRSVRGDPGAPPVVSDTSVRPGAQVDTILPAGPQKPYEVEADRLVLTGDRYFEAHGNVQITRDSLRAYAEQALYDRPAEELVLAQAARIEGQDYELFGETITLLLPGGEISEVTATRDALLNSGESLRMVGARIRLTLVNGELDRVYALRESSDTAKLAAEGRPMLAEPVAVEAGTERPEAVAEDFLLRADSIEVLTPRQSVDRVIAVGMAHGEALKSDTILPDAPALIRRDWLEGDTIIAFFTAAGTLAADSAHASGPPSLPERLPPSAGAAAVPEADTADAAVQLQRMVARGNARSLYRIVSADTVTPGQRKVSVHYVKGTEITIAMERGEVREVTVQGPTQGIHLEEVPVRPPPAAATAPETARPEPGRPVVALRVQLPVVEPGRPEDP